MLACVVGMKEWMQRICLSFTPSRIAESARLFHGSIRFQLIFFSRARDRTTFTLHDLTDFYVERVTAHLNYNLNDNLKPNSKTKLKLKHLWEGFIVPGVSGALRSLCILHKGRLCLYHPNRINIKKHKTT